MRIALLLLVPIIITATGCKSNKIKQRDLSAVKITVGQGGGFTGYYTDYIIYGTGKVEKYTTKDNTTREMNRVPADSVRAWVNRIDQVNFTGIELDQPGNMNYYMYFEEPGTNHKVRWGGAVPPADLEKLYNRIWNAVNN